MNSIRFCLILCVAATTLADDRVSWPVRSGPTLNGHVAAEDAKGIPSEFDEASGKNILWKAKIDTLGHSSPIIGHGKVWITSATEDGKRQYIHAFDATTGKQIHKRLLFENADPEPLSNAINTYASPSCALTDDAVYVHFGSYGTARLNPENAETVWERRDIRCRHYRGPGSSPILFEDLLLLTFDGVDAQFLTALNTETGKTVWLTPRSTDYGDLDANGQPKREGDLRKAYSTPAYVKVGEQTQLISVGSRAAFAYDAKTGKEIWGIRHGEFNAAAPPCFYKDTAILNTGSRRAQLIAVTLGDSTKGDVTDSHVAWKRPKGNSRLAAPLLIDGMIFMISDTGVATCVDAENGEQIWQGRIGGTHVASPITANGLIYFGSEEGDITVIEAAGEFKIVAKNKLEDGMRASLAAGNGRLYLRTFHHLYCIGEK